MKNYHVLVKRRFDDLQEQDKDGKNITRLVNDDFWCTKERYEFLNSKNAVELIEIKKVMVEQTKKVKKDVKDKQVQKPKNNNK